MIVQTRGTSGSGKSTAMRSVMGLMGDWQAVHHDGRKQPLYYRSCSDWPRTFVLGHYESACGGCDTIGSARAVYDLIKELTGRESEGVHVTDDVGAPRPVVLCEGLLLSEDVKWTTKLKEEGHDVRVIFLTTPQEQCLDQVRSRRKEAGNNKPLNEANTVNRIPVIERARRRLDEAGVSVRRASARQVPDIILTWLRTSGAA